MFDSKKTQTVKVGLEKNNRFYIDNTINNIQDYEEIDYSINNVSKNITLGIGSYIQSIGVMDDENNYRNEMYLAISSNVRNDHYIGNNLLAHLKSGTKVCINEEIEPYNDGTYEWVNVDYVDKKTDEVKNGWVVAIDYSKERPINNLISANSVKDILKKNISRKLNSEAAIIYDPANDEILFEKNGFELMEPASMTKVITAHIVTKYGNINDNLVYSKNAIDVDGKREFDYGTSRKSPVASVVKSGNSISVKDALHISLLLSDNATTVALQEYIESLTGRNFEDIMNDEIKLMGCKNSNLTNSFGFEDPNHVVTPYEMAKITAYINENNKEVIDIMGTEEYSFENDGKVINFDHKSSIIDSDGEYYNEDAIACKTGFTDSAGQTMVTVYDIEGKEYVVVTMKGNETESKFEDTEMLYDKIDDLLIMKENIRNLNSFSNSN